MEEEALLLAVASGRMDALEALYQTMRAPLFALLFALTRDRPLAEELLHDTFLKIYENADRYRPGGHPRAWMGTVARNTALDRLRRMQPLVPLDDRPEEDRDDNGYGKQPDRWEANSMIDRKTMEQGLRTAFEEAAPDGWAALRRVLARRIAEDLLRDLADPTVNPGKLLQERRNDILFPIRALAG